MYHFQIYGYTIPNHGKEKNGDSFLLHDLQDEKIVLAIVSDGVSGQPCDWKASASVCENIRNHVSQKTGQPLYDRLRESILAANEEVIRTPAPCNGMSATVSAMLWDYAANRYVTANTGDSRIYSVKGPDCTCLTKDDVIKHRETVYTSLGKRIIETSQLTQVIGKSKPEVHITEGSVEAGEVMLLATDGFYGARPGSFLKLVCRLPAAVDFKNGFDELVKDFELMRGDDLTVVALKRTV